MSDMCDECKEREVDFVLDDRTGYCAECMLRMARDRIEEKNNPKECPICKKKTTELLFHLATDHTKEEISNYRKQNKEVQE